jgi:DNA polymerase III alpha subunit
MDQFRVRSEFNFRKSFGQLTKVIAAGKAVGARAMALTDPNTFGHVSFYKAMKAAEMLPILGVELFVKEQLDSDDKRTCVFYASTTDGLSELYGWTTLASSQGNAITFDDVREMTDGIVKVASTQITESLLPAVDCIEANPVSAIQRRRAIELAKRFKKLVLPCSDPAYPTVHDKPVAELMGISLKPSPQWLLSEREMKFHMRDLPAESWKTHDILRERCTGVELLKAENIVHPMNLERACRKAIKLKVAVWNDEYEKRLKLELATIHAKKFDDYFAMLSGMCSHAKKHMLVGPARGSAAGSLVCFLLNITEIDPLVHDLMFERFIDETRYDFPDIDLDFPDEKREIVFEYLRKRYGAANVAHIGTVSRLKAKSAIGTVAKALDIPPWETAAVKDAMIERSGGDARSALCIEDTFKSIEIGQQFVVKYPAMMQAANLEDHAWHTGVHAAGALVCNKPVRTYCTVNDEGTAQLDKKDAEAINLMKVDVLGLRTLSLIETTGIDVRNVPLDDPKAFDTLNRGRFVGVFQFEGPALQSICKQIGVHEFEDIVAITSLARPGPLHSGGATSFVNRKLGKEKVELIHPIFDRITAKTQGMVLYQEQVMQLLREVGSMEWADVQILRRAMSKSLGLEFFEQFYERFVAGARANNVDEEATRKIWELMIHFGSYGFNRSHAVAYAIISYWCAWLKAHHATEFAMASLAHAKDEDQTIRLLREIVNEGQIKYIPFDREHSGVNWTIHNGAVLGGMVSIKGVAEKTAKALVKARDEGTLSKKQDALLANPPLMYSDLFPAARRFGRVYENPRDNPVQIVNADRIHRLIEIDDQMSGTICVIVKLNTKDIRSRNETQALSRRGGKRVPTAKEFWLNMEFEDDTDKIMGTVAFFDYAMLSKPFLNAPTGSWWLLRCDMQKGWRRLGIKKALLLDEVINHEPN